MEAALILVDIQNDFLPGGPLAVPHGDEIIDFVCNLVQNQERYQLVVATQDWHPADHGSFASTHPGRKPFESGTLGGLSQVFWPDHCIQKTEGARLAPPVRETLAEVTRNGQSSLIIQKGQDKEVDSYSAFFDNARRHETGLHRALQSYDIKEVDIVGLAFDVCVKATARDAASLGYRTRILMQGTKAIDPAGSATLVAELHRAGIECIDG